MISSRICEIMQYEKYWKIENNYLDFILMTIKRMHVKHYCFIKHNRDTNIEPHWHIFLRFKNKKSFKVIAKNFKVKENYVNKIHTKFKHAVLYADHTLQPWKFQYPLEEVICNFDFRNLKEKYLLKSQQTIYDFKNHTVFFYEDVYLKQHNIKKLRELDYIYEKWLNNQAIHNRDKQSRVIYISGGSGVGKTTYAKILANKYFPEEEIFPTSASKDCLYGYKGQKCIIMDELRGEDLSFSYLLRFLDNHSSSSVHSRYFDKQLWRCEVIIITSIYEPFELYIKKKEDMTQLFRRISERLEFIKIKDINNEKIYMNLYTWKDEIKNFIIRKKHIDITKIIFDFISKQKQRTKQPNDDYNDDDKFFSVIQ